MKKMLLWVLPLMISSVCHAEDITIHYNGSKAKVTQTIKDSVKVTVKDANVNIESLYKDHKLTLLLTGKSNDGQLVLKTAGKAKVKLNGLNLTSQEGAPIELKNKKKVEIVAVKGTKNTLTVTACKDTANHKGAVIWAKDKLLLSGKGTLNVIATGDGCRGIKTECLVAENAHFRQLLSEIISNGWYHSVTAYKDCYLARRNTFIYQHSDGLCYFHQHLLLIVVAR